MYVKDITFYSNVYIQLENIRSIIVFLFIWIAATTFTSLQCF